MVDSQSPYGKPYVLDATAAEVTSVVEGRLSEATSGMTEETATEAGFRHPGTYPKKRWVFLGTPT